MSTNRLRPAAFVVLRAESSASGGGRGLREGVGIAKGCVGFNIVAVACCVDLGKTMRLIFDRCADCLNRLNSVYFDVGQRRLCPNLIYYEASMRFLIA